MGTGKRKLAFGSAILAALASPAGWGEDRFPRPDFQSGYTMPETVVSGARSWGWEWIDFGVLVVALTFAAHLALRQRSRRGLVLLALFSVAYFGFWRRGCVCPVGSLQNASLGLFGDGYAVPVTVLLLFMVPLLFAALFGRVFCSAVCPLGAMQELVILKPLSLPTAVNRILSLIPPVYLAGAVLLAALGAGFPICKADPLVGFFRLSAPLPALIAGGIMLAIGTVVARPYCRFICPYGVLLGWMSRFSRWHAQITPDECIQCRLCERACPEDAILTPSSGRIPEDRWRARTRLILITAMFPVLVGCGAWLGWESGPWLAREHPVVGLEGEVIYEAQNGMPSSTLRTQAFQSAGQSLDSLTEAAARVRGRFRTGGAWAGAFVGAVFGARLMGYSTARFRRDYEPDRVTCVSCGRCFLSCPREHRRLGLVGIPSEPPKGAKG